MRIEFTIDGSDYSRNKADFKKILAKYGLKWKGDMRMAVWGNESETVTGVFVRNQERDITISATLSWEGGAKTKFFAEFEKWIKQFSPKSVRGSRAMPKKSDVLAQIEGELRFWDLTHKPDENALRAGGRPDIWIKRDIERWKRDRKKAERELAEKYGS